MRGLCTLPSVLFVASSLTAGCAGIILFTLALSPDGPRLLGVLTDVGLGLILLEAALLALYIFAGSRRKNRESYAHILSGDLRLIFWGGVVVAGFLVPLLLGAVYARFSGCPILLAAAGLFLLAGRLFLRLAILRAGVKDALPFDTLMEVGSL